MGDLSASMKFRTPPHAPLKIKARHRLIPILVLVVWLIYSLQPYSRISTPKDHIEMLPLIPPGQSIYIYQHSDPKTYQVGDVLWYRKKNDAAYQWGELIAIEADQIEIKEGFVYRNQERLPIMNLPTHLNKNFPLVQKDHWFIVHHNQESPLKDSLILGELPLNELEVHGKIFFNPSSATD